MHRFYHEEAREAANEYWRRVELERPQYYGDLPPLLNFSSGNIVRKTRNELYREEMEEYASRPPCTDEELKEFRRINMLSP
jgi:hypothetical protein